MLSAPKNALFFKNFCFANLVELSGTDLIEKYEEILKELAKEDGLIGTNTFALLNDFTAFRHKSVSNSFSSPALMYRRSKIFY